MCIAPVAQVPLKRLSYMLRRHEDAPGLHDGRTVLRTHPDGTSIDVDGSHLQDLDHYVAAPRVVSTRHIVTPTRSFKRYAAASVKNRPSNSHKHLDELKNLRTLTGNLRLHARAALLQIEVLPR